jgi:hypothetical protein
VGIEEKKKEVSIFCFWNRDNTTSLRKSLRMIEGNEQPSQPSAGRLEISEERFIPLGFECTVLWYKNRSNSETNHTGVVLLEFTHGNE